MKTGFVAAFAALALTATAAHAATAVYTITGTADGSLNGVAFTGADFTFTLTGDTADLSDNGSLQKVDPLGSASVVIDGFSGVTLQIPTWLSRLSNGTETAFNGIINGNQRNLLLWDTLTPVDLGHSFTPVSSGLVEVIGNTFDTSGGPLTFDLGLYFDNQRPITISASVREVDSGGAPEPVAWALMLLGFSGMGVALRRRRALALGQPG